MKQNINVGIKLSIGSSLFAALLGLSACAPSGSSVEGQADLAKNGDSSENYQPSRIIGGQEVAATDEISKMTGQLYVINPVKQKDPQTGKETIIGASVGGCTVSIVSKNLVLTAHHCLTSQHMFVYFSKDVVPESQQEEFFKTLATNPLVRQVVDADAPELKGESKDSTRNIGDILLLKLSAPIPDGFNVAPLLPTSFNLNTVKVVTLAGWGWTDGVKQTDTATLRKVEVALKDANFTESEILVGSVGKGACHGDSGGPAYVNVDGKAYVAGVTSRADMRTDPKGQCISDTIYTKTQFFNSWIVESAKNLNAPKAPEQVAAPSTVAKK
ncbi:MAG: trypsin-like serine protease [Bdellovibrionaceae bacterium]|nr:trypsin-like serine protease [Pseudobdellovibrionaceae bacterium]